MSEQEPGYGVGWVEREEGRVGDWMETYTGGRFWCLDLRPGDFRIEDIAHALANTCRYSGHCIRFYSVAEHCVRVSEIVPEAYALEALMHDATEAYLTDIPRPIKHIPEFAFYRELEEKAERAIATQFGLPYPPSPEVKRADNILLMTEARDLMVSQGDGWWKPDDLQLLKDEIVPWTPAWAERRFLTRFEEL